MGEIALVPVESIDRAWIDVKGFLQKVVDEYPFCQSMAWFESNLHKGAFQLWVNVEPEDGRISAAMVTTFYSIPGGFSTFEILGVGGEAGINIFQEKIELIKNFAKNHGAEIIIFRGRVGWKKVLRDKGFTIRQDIIMYKDLRELN